MVEEVCAVMPSDEEIARRLCEQKYIRACEFEVWLRNRSGESIYSMQRQYPNELRPGKFYYESTLASWVHKVNQAIADARLITDDGMTVKERYKIAVADGHDVRDAANPTPTGQVPTESSSWDAERLLAAGVIDRHSRKR